MKNLQISEQAHFLISRLRRSISRSRLRRTRLCSNVSLLAGYILKLTVLLIHLNGFYTHLNAIIFEKKRTWSFQGFVENEDPKTKTENPLV